jgi:hypothetical protein
MFEKEAHLVVFKGSNDQRSLLIIKKKNLQQFYLKEHVDCNLSLVLRAVSNQGTLSCKEAKL